jgi:hypothetical protein
MSRLVVAVLLALLGACAKPPAGILVDASAPVGVVLEFYGYTETDRPTVYLVPPDSRCPEGRFWSEDFERCIKGLADDRTTIYLAWAPGKAWSDTSLAHELEHFVGKHHPKDGNWAADSEVGQQIAWANALLIMAPSVNTINEDMVK